MFTKPRSRLLLSTLSLIILSLLLSLQPLLTNTQSTDSQPIVRLATYWDSPGHRAEISPDERHLIITDDNYTRVVEINTGRIILSEPDGIRIRFTPIGSHVIIDGYDSGMIQVINLSDLSVSFTFYDSYLRFVRNNDDIMMVERMKGNITQLFDLFSGELIGEFAGRGDDINPEGSLLSTVTNDRSPSIARVFDITTGDIVFERQYSNDTSLDTLLSNDNELFAVYHSDQRSIPRSYVYETDTWELRFTVIGGITFREDYQFAVSNNHADSSTVSLTDVATGEIIDTVFGGMYFGAGNILYRRQAVNYDFRYIQVIDLSTMEVLIEVTGYFLTLNLYDDILQVQQGGYPKTRYIDINTEELLYETEGFAEMLEINNNLLLIHSNNGLTSLVNWRIGETFIRTHYNAIETSPSENYFLVSNGQYIDLYGTPDMHVDTMPAPRPDYGFGELEAGDFQVYSNPEYPETAVEYSSLNPTMFEILGQSEDGVWVYAIFHWYDASIRTYSYRQGWIPAEQLTVIQSWEDVPILTPNLELFQLRDYAEEARSSQVQ